MRPPNVFLENQNLCQKFKFVSIFFSQKFNFFFLQKSIFFVQMFVKKSNFFIKNIIFCQKVQIFQKSNLIENAYLKFVDLTGSFRWYFYLP